MEQIHHPFTTPITLSASPAPTKELIRLMGMVKVHCARCEACAWMPAPWPAWLEYCAVKKYTATSGMFLLWSSWSLTCICQTWIVFPRGWVNQEVSSVILYPFLVSAASIVLQIPHLRASALLDTQGMGPIAQVCAASVGKIQGLQTPVEAMQRQGVCLWNKWHDVARGKIIQILFVSGIRHELCHALVEMFSSPELYTGCSWYL